MKVANLENLARSQRQYHRSHPWRLSKGGLYIPHSYAHKGPDSLSYWDDVGFILNGRRVIVWWQHPRHVYAVAIDERARKEAGENPQDDWLTNGATKVFRRVGRSRKKVVGYRSRSPSQEQMQYYELLRGIRARLTMEGIDLDVLPSWKRVRLKWATGVSLVAPLEVRSTLDASAVANLARRLILGKTKLEAEFPGYRYGHAAWLGEQPID